MMLLSVGKAGALRPGARTRWQSSRPATLVGKAHSSLQRDAVGARPIEEARPEERESHAPSFFERMGSPRFIAAPMVEQSEAGEVLLKVVLCRHERCRVSYVASGCYAPVPCTLSSFFVRLSQIGLHDTAHVRTRCTYTAVVLLRYLGDYGGVSMREGT